MRIVASVAGLILAVTPGCAGMRLGGPPAWAASAAPGPVAPAGSGPTPGGDPALRQTSAVDEPMPAALPEPPAIAPSIPEAPSTLPIDLPAALRLADSANPVIGEARARIGEALGAQLQARVILLPTLNAGASYDNHTGNLEQSDGRILNVDRQSLYVGGGASAVASGTVSIPAVLIAAHLGDAIFIPLAARQRVDASRSDAAATTNTTLLGVAIEYLELQAAASDLAARRRTEAEAAEVARITALYARTGQGRQADADRAETQKQLRRADIRKAEERRAVASARLARRLHLDPSATITPANASPEVFALVEADVPVEDLLRVAVLRRPEIQARGSSLAAAETQARQERFRPFLPALWVGFSGAAYGGGSNIKPPALGEFRGRTDFDAYANWTLLNFGAGNLANIRRREAQVSQAISERDRAFNLVREEVAAARADSLVKREKLKIAIEELAIAQDGYRKDLERIQQADGSPLEVLNNLTLLRKARESLIEAVLLFNQAQFRLFVAMGSPPPLELPARPAVPPELIEALVANPAGPPGVDPSPSPAGPKQDPAVASTGDQPGHPSNAAGSLERAKQAMTRASGDYERLQAELFRAIAPGGPGASREEMIRKLADLAEAHRREMTASIDHDKALWDLMASPKAP